MGAFVSNVTSPFLKRRKGRIGKDVWIEKTGPTFAGAEINGAAGNELCMICAPNFSNTYQYNRTQGDGAWTSVTLPGVNDRIGNLASSRSSIVARPRVIGSGAPAAALQNHFGAVGAVVATGGGGWRITPNGGFAVAVWTVAGAPINAISWTDDGKIFMAVGQVVGPNALGMGGPLFEAAEQFSIATQVGSNGFVSSFNWRTPEKGTLRFRNQPVFLSGDTSAGEPIRKLHRDDSSGLPIWLQFQQDANPSAGSQITRWMQHASRNLVAGVSTTADGIRSTDGGATWSAMNIEAGPVNDIWQYGNRLYAIKRDANRFQISRNFGASWAAGPAFPSGTAIPSISLSHLGERYILAHDGAVNRLYKMKHFAEI